MANFTDIEITLNAWEMNYVTVNAVQGESNGRTLIVTFIDRKGLTDGTFNAVSVNRPIDLTGVTARLFCLKTTDGTKTFSDGTITDATNGKASFVLPYQATTANGDVECQILLTKADSSTLKTVGLTLNVQASNLENAVESSNEYSALVTALNEVNTAAGTASQAAADAQKAVTDANTAITNISTKEQEITTAESTRVANEQTRQTAESSRVTAEQGRGTAEQGRADAETARVTEFNTLKTDSQTATQAANTAADRANTAAAAAENAIAGQLDPAIDSRITAKMNVAGGIAGYDSATAHYSDATKHITADERAVWNDKANKSTSVTATLTATGWTGTAAPYSQTISVTGVTATSVNEILPGTSIAADQLTALQAANLQDGGQTAGNITLLAYGDKPGVDLPVRIIIRGDM